MTREERKKAIEVLDDMKVKIDIPEAAKMQKDKNWALDIAIKALEQEPTVTSTDEPMTMVYPTIVCDDAISREDAIMMLTCEIKDGMTITEYIKMVDNRLRKLPPVTPSRPKGHWLYIGENGRDKWTCDNCFDFVRKPQKTCPNCGADMRGDTDADSN